MGRPDSEVYRGARLARALEWHDRGGSDLSPTEGAFLTAARNLAATEESQAMQRAHQQARTNRRLRALLAVAVVLMLLAAGAGIFAGRQARRANAVANSADARRLGTLAATTSQVDLALLLAVQGVRMDDTTATRAALFAALSRSPQLIRAVQAPEPAPSQIEISPDGTTLVVLSGSRIGIRTHPGRVHGSASTRAAPAPTVDRRPARRRADCRALSLLGVGITGVTCPSCS